MPKTLPRNSVLWDYSLGHNETHMSVPLSYGSIANDHESANIEYALPEAEATATSFHVRGGFQRGNCNVLNICMHRCTRTAHIYAHSNFQGYQRY